MIYSCRCDDDGFCVAYAGNWFEMHLTSGSRLGKTANSIVMLNNAGYMYI